MTAGASARPNPPNGPNQVSPPFVYGTDKRPAYDGSNHGNGFLATKLTMAGIPGLPSSEKITFTKAWTYKYFCMLHGPEMNGTIVVTP